MNTNDVKTSFMSFNEMGTNTASSEAIKATVPEAARAMDLWLKDGTVPSEYLRKQLGDQARVVIVEPRSHNAGPKPQS